MTLRFVPTFIRGQISQTSNAEIPISKDCFDIREQTLQAPPGLKDTLRQVFREILVNRGEPFSKVVLKEIVIKICKTRHTNYESLCLNFNRLAVTLFEQSV